MCLGALGVIERTWTEGGVAMGWVNESAVCLMYIPEAEVGDTVLVHTGFAIERIDTERATEALALRTEIAEFQSRKEAI